MKILHILFPAVPREFDGMRWVNISLRSFHLVAMAGYAGHFLAQGEANTPSLWWRLTLLSGLLMVLLALWSDGRWLLQWRGGVILLKLGGLGMLPWLETRMPGISMWVMAAVIVLSSFIAHAPGRWRYRPLVPQRFFP